MTPEQWRSSEEFLLQIEEQRLLGELMALVSGVVAPEDIDQALGLE